jgi:hypothetical protein
MRRKTLLDPNLTAIAPSLPRSRDRLPWNEAVPAAAENPLAGLQFGL